MAEFTYREGQATIFVNRQKKDGDSRPDYRGEGVFEGQPIELAAWVKTTKKGAKFLSMSVQRPQPEAAKPSKQSQAGAPAAAATGPDEPNMAPPGDIPF